MNDIPIIKSLFQCLENALMKKHNCLVNELSIRHNKIDNNYIIRLTTMRTIPSCVYIPSFIITPYTDMIETVGVQLIFARGTDGTIYHRIVRFDWTPTDQFISSFSGMRSGTKQVLEKWWHDTKFVMNGHIMAEKQVSIFKKELIERTYVLPTCTAGPMNVP